MGNATSALPDLSRKLNDDFEEIFGNELAPSEAALRSVAQITDAMFGGQIKMRRPTSEELVAAAIMQTELLQSSIKNLQRIFSDARGNLKEGGEYLESVLANLKSHQSDVQAGLE